MLVIRVDGNSAIGLGHVIRCLSIAEAARELGEQVCFLTACAECVEIIEQRGYEVILLNTDYRDMDSELPYIERLCEEWATEILFLVDSYQVNSAYYQKLRHFGKVACLEDMGDSYPVDLLINYNIYGADYADIYQKFAKSTLLGAKYMPLRAEFQKDRMYEVRDVVEHVLITTGGSDPLFASKGFVDVFLHSKVLSGNEVFHVVSGPMNSYAEELKAHYQGNSRVVIHENVKSMKQLMQQCDAVLTATGSTIYEVSSLGVPMICFYFVENQRRGAQAVERVLPVVNAGDYSKAPQQVIQRALEALEQLVQEKKIRESMYEKERALVDGKGADRIARALQELYEKR